MCISVDLPEPEGAHDRRQTGLLDLERDLAKSVGGGVALAEAADETPLRWVWRSGPLARAAPSAVLDAQAGPGTVSARAERGTAASAVTGAAMSSVIRPRLAARMAPMIAVTAPKPGACGTW